MKSFKNIYRRIKDIFAPPDRVSSEEIREVIPFFALITLAWLWMYIVFIQLIASNLIRILFSILMLVHLVLYWAVFRFINNNRKLLVYFILQGFLAYVIVWLAGDFGLAIGLYASLIGNSVGAVRRKRDLLLIIPLYLILSILAIATLSGLELILEWSYIALPSILFSAFIAFMFRRQLEMRDKAEILLAELQTAHSQLEKYAEQVRSLTLIKERQRIARELHDTLAQELTGVVLQLEAVSTHIEKDNPVRAQEILQGAMKQSRTTLSEARKVIDDLRTSETPSSSIEADLQREIAQFEALSQIRCKTTFDLPHPLHDEPRQHIIKIISEGLNNIAKHASADQVWLRVLEENKSLIIEIRDNGVGFDPVKEQEKPGHYGLVGIQERVNLLNGILTIDSQAGIGTSLKVSIPLAQNWRGG